MTRARACVAQRRRSVRDARIRGSSAATSSASTSPIGASTPVAPSAMTSLRGPGARRNHCVARRHGLEHGEAKTFDTGGEHIDRDPLVPERHLLDRQFARKRMRSTSPAAAISCLSFSANGRLSTETWPTTTAEKSGYFGRSRHIAATKRSLPCLRTRPNVPTPYFPGRRSRQRKPRRGRREAGRSRDRRRGGRRSASA